MNKTQQDEKECIVPYLAVLRITYGNMKFANVCLPTVFNSNIYSQEYIGGVACVIKILCPYKLKWALNSLTIDGSFTNIPLFSIFYFIPFQKKWKFLSILHSLCLKQTVLILLEALCILNQLFFEQTKNKLLWLNFLILMSLSFFSNIWFAFFNLLYSFYISLFTTLNTLGTANVP